MLFNLLEWALKVVVATFFLLLLSLLLWFVWNALMNLFHGPELGFESVALFAFVGAVAVGSWSFSLLHSRTTP
jgi:hypothetical protein